MLPKSFPRSHVSNVFPFCHKVILDLAPTNESLAPANESLASTNESLAPTYESLAPTNESLAPANESLAPTNESTSFQKGNKLLTWLQVLEATQMLAF